MSGTANTPEADVPSGDYGAFEIPLNSEQLETLGLIAVVWGHIDVMLDELIMYAHQIDNEQRNLLLGDKQNFGAKLDTLARGLGKLRPKETKAKVQRFVQILQACKQDRNAIFHAGWGWRFNRKTRKFDQVAAHYPPSQDNARTADHLKPLLRKLRQASVISMEALCDLKGWGPPKPPVQLTFGGADPKGGPSALLIRSFGQFEAGRPHRASK